jgi:hypothetical protein
VIDDIGIKKNVAWQLKRKGERWDSTTFPATTTEMKAPCDTFKLLVAN